MGSTENALKELKAKIIDVDRKHISKDCLSGDRKSAEDYYKNFTDFRERFDSAHEDSISIIKLIQRLADKISSKETTLLELSSYLILVEGLVFNSIDYLCYILVSDGHDIYNVGRRTYAENISDIAKISIKFKLEFLNYCEYNIEEFFDLKFRNDIAHHNYTIDEDGHLWIAEKQINIRSQIKKLEPLIDFINSLFIALTNEFEKILKDIHMRNL